ncbi:DUF2326 domain-containing protein [Bradyrhizobium sp. USDA 4501]
MYHDGIFEALDDRKKLALLEVVREQTATKKTQYIMTLIASDLPRIEEKSPPPSHRTKSYSAFTTTEPMASSSRWRSSSFGRGSAAAGVPA